jgi:hypothetical protein
MDSCHEDAFAPRVTTRKSCCSGNLGHGTFPCVKGIGWLIPSTLTALGVTDSNVTFPEFQRATALRIKPFVG